MNTNPAEGMRDFSPKDVELRRYLTNKIIESYRQFGFEQIETPCVERIQFLTSGDGGDNEKMLFKILKRGEKLKIEANSSENDLADLGLRYDLTVPLCRFYANNKTKLPAHFKTIQVGNVWRAERPQKGRFRQFTQCDIDIIGIDNVLAETQLILATSGTLKTLGFSNFTIRVNDRRILESLASHCGFETAQFEKVFIIFDKLDKIGIDGVQQELEQAQFSTDAIQQFISLIKQTTQIDFSIESLKTLLPEIPENVIHDLQMVIDTIRSVSNQEYKIQLDVSLVRGMGYYTGQIFEIGMDGYRSSIAGGGRYNKMIAKILGSDEQIPACGFSIGFERVLSILEEQGFTIPETQQKIAILYKLDASQHLSDLYAKVDALKAKGNIVSVEIQIKNTKKQLDDLKAKGFSAFAFYQPENELQLKLLS